MCVFPSVDNLTRNFSARRKHLEVLDASEEALGESHRAEMKHLQIQFFDVCVK